MGMGSYVEIEAQAEEGEMTEEHLLDQCRDMMKKLGIRDKDLVKGSYSDMMMDLDE